MKVAIRQAAGKSFYWLWCPACDCAIMIDDAWGWNGDSECPTFTPSILSKADGVVCHSFLTDGVWNFLSDCTHASAGQRLPAVDLPEWLLI